MTQAPAEPQKWLLSGDLPCLGCGYNLRGLVGPLVRCPECGHANDLTKPGPWKVKSLPLGVRVRDHWPASAVLCSLPTALLGFALVVTLLEAPFFAHLPGIPFVAVAGIWGWFCRRWLHSVQRGWWAVGVLAGIHIAAWLVPGSVILIAVMGNPWPIVLAPVGAAGILALSRVIRRADEQGQFRVDWRRWQLPLGSGGAPTPDAKAEILP